MNMWRLALRAAFGRRLVQTTGDVVLPGLESSVSIRRDRYGIPHIVASSARDAWTALGFCHGQDRAFQIEMLVRVVRGTVAALVGPQAIPIDRFSRRLGFLRAATAQMDLLDEDVRGILEAYVSGVNRGRATGRAAHEFALLRARPDEITVADVLGIAALQGLFLGGWASELVRWRTVSADGPAALAALDGPYPDWLPVTDPPGARAGPCVDALATDLDAFATAVGAAGGSNNWVVAGTRTATGRPILANDPHLAPVQPAHWYLGHIKAPTWEAAGGTLVGLPGFLVGHNEIAAWGLTAAMGHNADLVLEELGPDGRSVRRDDGFVECEVHREVIEVRRGRPIVEEVLVTPAGPIIGPAVDGQHLAIALRATWLQPRKLRAALGFHLVRSFDDLRATCRHWPTAGQNVVYADTSGTIGWQFSGDIPRRRARGSLPALGWDPAAGWDGDVPADALPHAVDPDAGWIATANNKPVPGESDSDLGADWVDGYRVAAVGEALDARRDWDLAATLALQLDVASLPWRELRDAVLAAPAHDPDTAAALTLLARWDGRVTARSPAAAVFEFFAAEMTKRVARAKAPGSVAWIVGRGVTPLTPHSNGFWRTSRLVRLISEQPEGWFRQGWPAEIGDALAVAHRRVATAGAPSHRGWGDLRPLTFRHPLSSRTPLARIFDLGPFPWGGDSNTIAQTGPGIDGHTIAWAASMRVVLDVGNWDAGRFALPGGQSGNPLSPHYDDLLDAWRAGTGVPIAWTEPEVAAATVATLRLTPAHADTP